MDYERRILVADGPDGELQRLSLELIERGYSVHYANDPFEAQLLAQEERGQIGAVLLTSQIALAEIPELARRFGLAAGCFIPSGSRPVNAQIEKLGRDGVRWHLWDDPSDHAVRFVLDSVLSEHDPFELRFYLRVPVEFKGELQLGNAKSDVQLRDICLGGACLVGNLPASKGQTGELRFEVGETQLALPVSVAWSTSDTGDGVNVLGVSFTEVDLDSGEVIDGLVDEIIGRHRIKGGRAKRR